MTEIPATDGCFLRTGSSCKAQGGRNNMQCRPGKAPGYFAIENGPEEGKIDVCLGSCCYVYHEEKAKNVLARILQIESFVPPPFSFLLRIGTGNMRELSILVIQTCVITFTSIPKLSNYLMPLSQVMAVAL